MFKRNAPRSIERADLDTCETYVAIQDTNCWQKLDTESYDAKPGIDNNVANNAGGPQYAKGHSSETEPTNETAGLNFIPFHYRANRHGRGVDARWPKKPLVGFAAGYHVQHGEIYQFKEKMWMTHDKAFKLAQ